MRITPPPFWSGLLLSLLTFVAFNAQAESERFGDYVVHYSVFNSTFLQPDIAQAYGLLRARDRALVNVSIVRTGNGDTTLGLPARVSGAASNLMQQRQSLEFMEISEGEATYYIAPLRHTNEETYNLAIEVQPETGTGPFELTFSRKLYVEK